MANLAESQGKDTMLTNPSIFVTGGTGLVGSYLLKELLKSDAHIKALYRNAFPSNLTDAEIKRIEWIKGDVLDIPLLYDAMKGVDQVYHSAAIVTFSPKRKKEMFRINIEGTANVVNAAIENEVKKLVHVSSVSAMGRIRTNVEIDESMFWTEETSNSNYGKSKYLSEMEVWRGIGEGLKAVIVNPTIILGAGDWESSSSKIFKSAYENFPWYTDGGGGFVDVRDVVRSMIMLMESDITAQRFLINSENRPYREIFSEIAKQFGKRPPYKKATPFLSGMVWRIEWLKTLFSKKEPLLTRETALTGRTRVYFNNSKLKKFLPSFEYIPVNKSIAETCRELSIKYKL